jgi:polyhydroxyalkanoate synthase
MLSWKNVQNDQGGLTWDDYLDTGVITAINTVREICDVPQINALGFCVGGTIISTALAVMAARGEKPVASLTLLTTLLDFEDPGVLNLFVDEAHVSWRESTLGHGGLMPGAELAQTFSALRPNDLIWNYVSRNYLQGEKPPAFDLLYWNSDSTNLPGPMFAWYLRHMYLQNDLVKPNQLTCLGQKVDLARIDVPVFIYGSRDDHIVPWHAAYGSRSVLGGPTEFVLGASGHIAGVINHPAKNKRNYWVNDSETPEADEWLASASRIEGSWWPHWADWLASFSGRKIKAPSQPGGASHHSIEPAPGRYVRQPA